MSKQHWKLLLCAAGAITTLVVSLFVSAWFRVDVAGNEMTIDLRDASMCALDGTCVSIPLSKFKGFYSMMADGAFYTAVPVLILVVVQTASRLVTGIANTAVTKVGYVIATSAALSGLLAGYMFAPESLNEEQVGVAIVVTRTWAPLLYLLGNLLALFAMYMASMEWLDDDVGEYKPIKLDKPETGRLPVTPLSVARISPDSRPLDGGRPTRAISQPGHVRGVDETGARFTPSQPFRQADETGRTKPPTQPPGVASAASPARPRARTASQQPLGVVEGEARSKSPSQQPLVSRTTSPSGLGDSRAKSPSQQSFSGRTTPSSGVADPRTKSPSQQSFSGRTTPPSGVADPRSKSPSQQPLVARTTSPSGLGDSRSKSPSQQSFSGRTTPASGVADPRSKSPSQQPLVARTTSPGLTEPRSKPPSQPPLVARTTSPSGLVEPRAKPPTQPPLTGAAGPHLDPVARSRTSSSGPIDLAARLSAAAPHGVLEPLGIAAAPVEVSIRPPLPQPEPVPPDQIPVDPAAGITIRKRAPSVVNEPVPPVMPSLAIEGNAALTDLKSHMAKPGALPVEDPVFPAAIRKMIKYAVVTADITASGITANREDGAIKNVDWERIVGVIARRLPPDDPYGGVTIVDIVSAAGSTLRIVPWTRLRGGLPLDDEPVERARGLVNLVAAQALGAKLDATTKVFADGTGQAAQLPTVAMLGTHDQRLA